MGLTPENYLIKASSIGYNSQYNGQVEDISDATPITVSSGSYEVNFILAVDNTTNKDINIQKESPTSLMLHSNYPNPFNLEVI